MEQYVGRRPAGERGLNKPKRDYQPPIVVCKLWVKTSAKGERYLTGRMGGARVLVMPNPDRQNKEDASHVLKLAQAPPATPKP